MPMLEIGLGLMCVVAGGGAGWLGRGKYEAKLKEDAAFERKARRVAGGQKAASTRRTKAEKKVDPALIQRQQMQMQDTQTARSSISGGVDAQLYGRAGNGVLHGGE